MAPTALPAGRTPHALPVAVQVVGRYLDGLTTLRFAELAAGVPGTGEWPPGFAY